MHFASAVLPPTPFKLQQAKAQGKELRPEPGFPIWGHLSKPRGARPSAGVPFVDRERIGVVGWSHGGISALEAVHVTALTARLPQRFKAAIAFYPYCIDDRRFELPVLVLIGKAGDRTPAAACRSLEARNRRDGGAIELVVYHSFDVVEVKKGWAVPGGAGTSHWLKYDRKAHEDSIARVDAFLAEHLSRP